MTTIVAVALGIAVFLFIGSMVPRRGAGPVTPLAPPSPEVVSQARALLAAGKKLEAIKLVRAECRAGLKEAKDYVESLE